VSIKATSLLSILAIWVTMIPAVIAQPDAWWSLIFAALATGAIGASAWRRLGLSRVIAISGTWLGTAIAAGNNEGAAWVAVMAFLATAAVVYSTLRRDAVVAGIGIAVPWIFVGAVAAANDGDGAWIAVFAFLGAATVANAGGKSIVRGASAILWWGLAGLIMLVSGGWFWLSVVAFLLTAISLGISDFRLPTGLEWDLFDRDEEDDRPGEPFP
jgi:hypothetical protein